MQTAVAEIAPSLEPIPTDSRPNPRKVYQQLAVITAVLLLIAASRILQMTHLQMNGDDIWTIWQTFGTPADIIRWTPYDWPPLHFLVLGAWKELVGIQPVVLRFSSVLAFMLGLPCLYRFVRRVWDDRAALLSILAYAALGYSLYLSLFIRAYVLLLALTPLVLWLTARYFDHPSVRRGIYLALGMIAMFYSHYTSFFAFALIGLYTLFVYRQAIWHWWLPSTLTAIAAIPQIVSKWEGFATRTIVYRNMQLPPLPQAVRDLAAVFTGPTFLWWVILFVLASVLIIFRRSIRPQLFALAIWVCTPVGVYLLQDRLGLFQSPKYLWWVLPGLAVWIGWGLSRLPNMARRVVGVVLVVAMFWPTALDAHQPPLAFDTAFQGLRNSLQPDDVILIDPNCDCKHTEAWDYYMRLYFPNGLRFVNDPARARRVWYVSRDWQKDLPTQQLAATGRVAGTFFGPPSFLFRLYEAPPDVKGVLFENGMRFHGAEVIGVSSPNGVAFRAGQTVRVRLWWSVDRAVGLDYSVGVYLPTDNVTVQVDGPPQVSDAPKETSRWVTGRYYIDERQFTLPPRLYGKPYPIFMSVYQWWDNVRIAAPGVNQDKLLPIQTISVHAW